MIRENIMSSFLVDNVNVLRAFIMYLFINLNFIIKSFYNEKVVQKKVYCF